jgi:hypothetical protein
MLDRCFSGVEDSTLEYSTSGAKLHYRELVELEVYGQNQPRVTHPGAWLPESNGSIEIKTLSCWGD